MLLYLSADPVILEMPAFPVTAGDSVILRCSYKERFSTTPSSDFPAVFYKNDVFIGKEPTGKMTLGDVSMSDAGFYRCEHPERGKSPTSWLTVRGKVMNLMQTTTEVLHVSCLTLVVSITAGPPTVSPPEMSLPRLVCTVVLVVLYSVTFILCVHVHFRWTKGKRGSQNPPNNGKHIDSSKERVSDGFLHQGSEVTLLWS